MTYALALRWERPPRYWHTLAVDSLFDADQHSRCNPPEDFSLCDRAFFVIEHTDDSDVVEVA